jgi:ribonuclease HI
VKLHFIKVKGHTGVEGNERADSLAKEAVSEKISFNQLVIE